MELKLVNDLDSNELRTLAVKPKFKIDELYDYLSKYDAYFNDNYGVRNFLYSINAKIKYQYLKKSPLPNKVIIGKDNWLFLSPDIDVTISEKVDYLDPTLYKIFEDSLISKTEKFKEAGIKYYVLLTPEKSYTYSEMLPANFDGNRIMKRFDLLLSKLKSNPKLNIIIFNETLLEAKRKDTIGLQYDTHWNSYGAFSAYQHLMRELKKDYPSLQLRNENDFEQNCTTYKWGDLANQIGICQYILSRDCRFKYVGPGALNDTAVYSNKSTISYEFTHPQNKDKPDIIFLHDSYGNPFLPWLINDFHTMHSARMTDFKFIPEFYFQLGPKIVLHQMVPRHSPLYELLSSTSSD